MTSNFNANFKEFRKKITPTSKQSKILTDARGKIRAHIKKTFSERSSAYFNEDVAKILSVVAPQNNGDGNISPRFMTQGSFAYKTLNYPDKPPKQHMDLDYGVYFSLTQVTDDNQDFEQVAIILREIITECLKDIVIRNHGWEIEKKEMCIRVTVALDAHIDLPIYSIPDKEFKTIIEKSTQAHLTTKVLSLTDYDEAENVLIATDHGWVKSDPRVIHAWVQNVATHFEDKFLPYSRYVKAWRDHQWKKSDISSILIMAGVCQALQEIDYVPQSNVALELEFVVRKIAGYLNNGGIDHPDASVDENLDVNAADKIEIDTKLQTLANNLNQATKNGDVAILCGEFGTRFPSKPEDTSVSKLGAPAVIVTSSIASAAPIKQSGAV